LVVVMWKMVTAQNGNDNPNPKKSDGNFLPIPCPVFVGVRYTVGMTNTPRKQAALRTLIATARKRPDGEATASSGKWWAFTDADGVNVGHHSTLMFVRPDDDTVTAVSAGWGSMTDKCGTRAILSGAGIHESWHTLYATA